MTDTDAPRPGPWGSASDSPSDSASAAAPRRPPPARQDGGQTLLWAVISTVLLAGWLGWIMGWMVALAGVVGIFVHEYGHVLMMNRLGMGPARITIIPFLGGAAHPRRAATTEFHGVLVALAGPLFGLLAALPFAGLYLVTGVFGWLEGAFFIALLNFVNLAPAPPLDGSRALGPVLARGHPLLEKVALLLVGLAVLAWALMTGRLIFGAFIAIAALGHLKRGAWRPRARRLDGREATLSLGLYLLTAILCAGAGLLAVSTMVGGDWRNALEAIGHYLGIGQ